MFSDNLPQASVQLLSMFVEHHCVGISVQFLKAEAAVILPLNLLDGILQKVPDIVYILLIHRHLQKIGSNGFKKMTITYCTIISTNIHNQGSSSYMRGGRWRKTMMTIISQEQPQSSLFLQVTISMLLIDTSLHIWTCYTRRETGKGTFWHDLTEVTF